MRRKATVTPGFPPATVAENHHFEAPLHQPSAPWSLGASPLPVLPQQGRVNIDYTRRHPLVLPQKHLLSRVKEEALQPLLAVMHWVGSKYIAPEMDQQLLLDIARLSVDEAQTKKANGFTVQAMTVLLVALDGTGYPQQAVELLTRTKQMALSLGMNYSRFMTESKTRFRVLDESWRRTWWELYVLDGMFAGAHRATTFSLLDVPTDVGLPCEDDDYETDQIPEPCSLEDLSDRDLSIERCDFSSFSYRVLSVQNLGKVIQHYEAAEVDANVHAQLEVLLSSWRHNLPASKRDSLQRDGRPDEMMFQAHMLNHTTSILLHRSRAQLDLGPTQAIDACTPPDAAATAESDGRAAAAHHPRVSLHARHVATAANEIGKLITHRTPLTLHTHFFICAVVLASIVQLGAWSGGGGGDDDDGMREQVRLCIGALRQMSSVWGLATKALGQVREVAGHVHFVRTQSRQLEQFLVDVTEEDMMSMFAADTSTLADIDTV
ncbi:hypothetical protein G3M48_001236 [Beauveria asiatica]|uniref:Xylanolytic transcriptional activator regulatory domain-containing protein n=1 Tax=Beauveria asiatica TaxID=1069075 RepID=A0AAW0S063_9HYPO